MATNTITYTWDAVVGVDGYNLYLSDDGGSTYTKQNTTLITGTTYVQTNLDYGDYKAYIVASLSTVESNPSNIIDFSVEVAVPESLSTSSTEEVINSYSLNFNGVNDYVSFGDVFDINNEDRTIECWFKINAGASGIFRLIEKRGQGGWGTAAGMQLSGSIGSSWGNTGIDSGASNHIKITSSSSAGLTADDGWHHAALVWNNTTGTLTFYIDGAEIQSITNSSLIGVNFDTIRNDELGRANTFDQYFNGRMFEVRYWSTARTATEITNNKDVLIDESNTDLIALYRLSEGAGSTVEDLIGVNDGTINGATWVEDVPELLNNSQTEYTVEWSINGGVDSYNVYLSDDGGSIYTKQNTSPIIGTSYNLGVLTEGNYNVYVTAVSDGVESDPSNVISFEVIIGPVYSDDFSSYPIGQPPEGWSQYGANLSAWRIEDDEASIGGKSMEWGNNFSGFYSVIPDELEALEDSEMLVGYYRTGASNPTNLCVYARQDKNDLDSAYYAGVEYNSSTNNFAIYRGTTKIAESAKTITNNEFWWIRFQVIGSNLKAKFWKYSQSEPSSWDLEVTDNNLASGFNGVGSRSNSVRNRYDYFAVSNGETIPVPS